MNAITTATTTTSSAGFGRDQENCLEAVMAQAKVLNAAIARAVDAGLIVEVGRASRYHTPQQTWGDQITAVAQTRG